MLFTFPSRYWFTIGLTGVFSLTGWSRRIRAELLVFRVTQDTAMLQSVSNKGLSPAMALLSRRFFSLDSYNVAVLLPRSCVTTATVWASSPFARHYWGNHCLFSFPAGTKMFQFPALAPTLSVGDRPSDGRVVPFGNPRIRDYLHLPGAYRSLSRPSSPL